MDVLESMQIFAEVARAASFTRGAKRCHVSTRVASATVKALENRLGVRLMNRTTRSVRLTDAGQAYLQRCQQLLHDFDELESAIREEQAVLAGPIRLTAPTAFGGLYLAPALAGFMKANPQVSIDLELSDRRTSVIEEGYDVAIRIGLLTDSTLMYRVLSDMNFVVCGAPEYFAEHGVPSHPNELRHHQCLNITTLDEPHLWRFVEQGHPLDVSVSGRFQANAPLPVARMAKQGLGLAQVPIYLVKEDIEQGHLIRVLGDFERRDIRVNALYPPNRHLNARIRGLLEYLSGIWNFDSASMPQ